MGGFSELLKVFGLFDLRALGLGVFDGVFPREGVCLPERPEHGDIQLAGEFPDPVIFGYEGEFGPDILNVALDQQEV